MTGQPAGQGRACLPGMLRPVMPDASLLAFHLTYAGTLGVAAVMVAGQLLALTALLVLAAAVRVMVWAAGALGCMGAVGRSADPGTGS